MVNRSPSIKRIYLPKPYPENLILTLLMGNMDSYEITPDIEEGVEYALELLTEVEQEVLRLRFQEHLTYMKIGAVRGHTGHGACGTENNAMRKLRSSPRLGYLLYGMEGFKKKNCVFHLPWEEPKPQNNTTEPDPDTLLITLEELDLTVRSFNVLRRAGYEYVGDIITLTYEQIQKINHLPIKNCREVAEKLRTLGLKETAWADFI